MTGRTGTFHTNFDTAANIDPTKLKRAAFYRGGERVIFLAGALQARILPNSQKETRGWQHTADV